VPPLLKLCTAAYGRINNVSNAAAPCDAALPISSPNVKGMMSLKVSTTESFFRLDD